MRPDDIAAAKKVFAAYYEKAELKIPAIEQREFGIGNQKKIDSRHLNFASVGEFRNYLCSNTPMFVSHSISYYGFPGASPMAKKEWRGADLVFDLDIHAEGKYGAYAHLQRVKEDASRLVRDFLLGDFGIKKENLAINFSGNRGYHIHVREPSFLPLKGDERRELVDYIMGQGLDYRAFFPPSEGKRLIGPRPDEGGYRGRFARDALRLVSENPGALSRVFLKEKARDFFISGIREGNWGRTSLKFEDLKSRLAPIAAGLPVGSVDTDAGVTQDLSKLIRVPNTIHGDTGMVARIVDDLEKFDPWRDAMLRDGDDAGEMKVCFAEDVPQIAMDETHGPFKKDEEKALPRHLAVFFVLKGSAIIS